MQTYERIDTPNFHTWLAGRNAAERETLAQLWGLASADRTPAALAQLILDPDRLASMLAAFSPLERAALAKVQEYGGSIPAAVLEREYGRVRYHAEYVNPRAYLLALQQPAETTERLWLRGLLQELRDDASRFYAIPAELLALLPAVPPRPRAVQIAPTDAPQQLYLADARALERRLLTLLMLAQNEQLEVIPSGGLNKASLVRLSKQWNPDEKGKGLSREDQWPYVRFLRQLAHGAGLLRLGADARLRPTGAALEWMRRPQAERARILLGGWVTSEWDELSAFSKMKFQRAYTRDLPATRRAVVWLLGQVAPNVWVSLDEFVATVKRVEPDFARADGRYDSWGIQSYTRESLDGFAYWDAVEGEQLRSMISGTLRWLGLIDLGEHGEEPHRFRINPLGAALLCGDQPPAEPEIEPLVIQPNFEVIAPRYAALDARFQLARVAEPGTQPADDDAHTWTLTRRSVQAALDRQIGLDDLLRFLREHSGRAVPQNVAATLREWAALHGQVSLRKAVLLEADDPTLLERIRHDKRIKMPLVEPISANAWLVREGDAPTLAERIRKAGYGLTGDGDAPQTPIREHDLTVLFAALEFYAAAGARLGIEGEVSGALRQRIANMLSEKQYNRAHQTSVEAMKRLKERLG